MRLAFVFGVLLSLPAAAETLPEAAAPSTPPEYSIFNMSSPEDRLRAIARMQDAARMPSDEEIAAATAKWRQKASDPEVLMTRIEESDLSLQDKMAFSLRVQAAEGDLEALGQISRDLNVALQ